MPLWKFFGRGLRTLANSAAIGHPALRHLGGKFSRDKIGNRDLPAIVRPVQREQAGLQADEGDGVRRAHRAPEDLPGIGMQAARDVQREDRAGLRVGVVDQLRVLAVDRPGQADAEQAVDHEVPADVLRDFFRLSRKANPEEPLLQNPRNDLRVAAVVAGTGQDQHVLALVGEQPGRQLRRRGARALHEGQGRVRLLDAPDVLRQVDGLRHRGIIAGRWRARLTQIKRQRSSSYLPPFSSARW